MIAFLLPKFGTPQNFFPSAIYYIAEFKLNLNSKKIGIVYKFWQTLQKKRGKKSKRLIQLKKEPLLNSTYSMLVIQDMMGEGCTKFSFFFF